MAGNKRAYHKAISKGLNLAWEGHWEQALTWYQRALAEVSDDPAVYHHLGLAYLQLERLEQALEAYQQASRLDPEDPLPLARIAEIHERLEQAHEAADVLLSLAQIYQRQQAWAQAIQALQQAIHLHPNSLEARRSLAEIYAELGQSHKAAQEHIRLACSFQRLGDVEKALEQCNQALELDPGNADARVLMEALRLGEPVEQGIVSSAVAGEKVSPVEMTRDKALEELAGILFEETAPGMAPETPPPEAMAAPQTVTAQATLSRPQLDAVIAQAIDLQTRGQIDRAIACYNQAIEAGIDRPAVYFNLGLLYQQRLRFEQAIAAFKKAVRHKQYALGSHFALGECYKALGRIDEALEHFVQALKIVDLGTVKREQADDLIGLYDALAESYIAKGDREKALEFTNSLIEFLSSKGWEDKAREARRRIDSLAEDGVTMSLAEVLATPNAEAVLSAISLSQEYMRRGALTAATDICYRAIESAPVYLPLHVRLAEIFVQDGRIEDAVAKYQVVADLYLIRKETRRAIAIYKRMLRLAPMDVGARARLIDLLISSGEIDQALEQYLALADAYYQLAQVEKAMEKYTEALRLTPRASEEQTWRLRLLRKMTDVQMRRGNWREAAELYQQIVTLCPDDERARLQRIDLCYRLGRTQEADKETVEMIAYYRSRGQGDRVVALLQEAVRLQPTQMALRARLARAYTDAGLREKAIAELNTLAELQLKAGLKEQAIATIRFIIALTPPNIEMYRKILSRLQFSSKTGQG
ncbi:MAG: tetratricopeptide repeat protein [Anaerolineae bacterium]